MSVMRIPRHIRIIGLILLVTVFLWGCFALVLHFSPYPAFEAFTDLPCSTRVYDCTGKLLQILPLEDGLRRERVALDDIPVTLQQAFISAEDRHFYSHCGVDAGAILRALFQNISAGKTVSGGSTITMQLARLITPRTKRNLATKCREAFDALRLESRLSKEQILELYLNHIYFGFNTEGVASAARTFFSKEIGAITQEEACLLAVIPRSPAQYNPFEHPEACTNAALPIYTELAAADNHNDSSASAARELLYETALHANRFSYPYEFPHFIRFLTEQSKHGNTSVRASTGLTTLITDSGFFTESEVCLSVSLQVQNLAQDLLSRMLEMYSRNRLSNGAVIAFDTQTGEIISWVGSGDFSSNETEGQIDGVITPNQPGSSMKPFLYALALDCGYTPATILPDIPHDFGSEELYIPQNFNNRFNGPVTLRVALASSLNVPAVWLLNKLGLSTYREKLLSLGFDSLATQNPGLSLALGGAEVTLLELTRAFSIFSRDGIFIPLKVKPSEKHTALQGLKTDVRPATEASNSAISSSGADSIQMYDKNTARLIADILSDADARALGFGYASVFQTPFSAIFKTGTANQYQNITALASTPLYTVGVWMGNFTGETVIGKTGSSLPAAIAKEILCFLQNSEEAAFETPEQYQLERICSLSGMKAGEACPNTRLEYLPSGNSAGICTWHTENNTIYPEEYQNWLSLKKRAGTVTYGNEPLTIDSPRDGSVFFYDASALGRNQVISVSVTGGIENVLSVQLTDEMTGNAMVETEVMRPFTFTLPLSKGIWKLNVRNGDESDSISYTVR